MAANEAKKSIADLKSCVLLHYSSRAASQSVCAQKLVLYSFFLFISLSS